MENNFFDIYAFVLGSINFFFYNNHLEKRMVKIGQEMRFLANCLKLVNIQKLIIKIPLLISTANQILAKKQTFFFIDMFAFFWAQSISFFIMIIWKKKN